MPSGRQLHIDAALSDILVATFETEGDFIAQQLFPVVPVDKQSNKYYTLRKEAWLATPRTHRAPRTRANIVEFDISSDAYFCSNYALAGEIPLEDLANADAAIRLRDSTTRLIGRGLLADKEVRVAAAAYTGVATVIRNSGADAWTATTSADIQAQIHAAHQVVFRGTGMRANALFIDYDSYLLAKRNQLLFSKFQYRATGPAMISDAQLMEALMVDRIVVARSQKNNANIGQAASITSIWGPTALLARVEQSAPSMMTATFGLSFRWTNPSLGTPMAVTTKVEDEAGDRHVEILEAGYHDDEKVVGGALGVIINTVSGTAW